MTKRKTQVVLVRTHADSNSSFIARDLEILRRHYDMRVVNFIFSKKNIPGTVSSLIFTIKQCLWADVSFSWFASTHAFITVLLTNVFGKKSIVVVGGLEVAKIPEIGYGLLLNPRSAREVKYVLKNADKVLTVDKGLKEDAIRNIGVSGENIQTVPLGFDYKKFKPKGEKQDLVVTVAGGDSIQRIPLKGLNTFVKSAELLPDAKFLVVGVKGDALRELSKISPSNVDFVEFMLDDELIHSFQKAKVYCQLSMREGHPNAICEAMLCGCVPVGSNVQGVRTVIGDSGFLVEYGDVKETVDAIKKALETDSGEDARNRIKELFSVDLREKRLVDIINKVLG